MTAMNFAEGFLICVRESSDPSDPQIRERVSPTMPKPSSLYFGATCLTDMCKHKNRPRQCNTTTSPLSAKANANVNMQELCTTASIVREALVSSGAYKLVTLGEAV